MRRGYEKSILERAKRNRNAVNLERFYIAAIVAIATYLLTLWT